jgi:outer membrane protein assembly factor BamB
MANTQTGEIAARKPLRLWPGVIAAGLALLLRFVVPIVAPDAMPIGIIGGLVCALLVLLWWLFFSRAPWAERLAGIALIALALFVTKRVVHPSIANGMMGMLLFAYGIPIVCAALVAWAAATRGLSDSARRASMVAVIVLACGAFTLIRTGGITGDADSDFHWRWTPTPEERLLARAAGEPAPVAPAPRADTPAPSLSPEVGEAPKAVPSSAPAVQRSPTPTIGRTDTSGAAWPGFRGPDRDGIVHGVRIETDWSGKPPVQMWRRPVGPGWSSFAVHGDVLFTQEQRGEDEVVAAYKVATGEPVWRHKDPARFWESNAGAGPRATPTLSNGRVYTHGGTGIVNALNAADGAVVWSRNAATDTGRKTPPWGFASSPLVVGDVVIVAAAGSLVAYDRDTGKPRWFGPKRGGGYSSPHLATIDGVPQVLLLNGTGLISVAPADGALLWEHSWPGDSIVQPGVTTDGDVLMGSGSGMGNQDGLRRVAVEHGTAGWTVKERWTSNGLKPYYNDFVVHKGHAFGFDGAMLACVDLKDGQRKWKGGRYGHGQLVLLPDQDLLLVLSEEGELALVKATPDQFAELARVPAIEGKTWNHPVVVGDVVLARNDQEMAAFRLPAASR